MTDIDTTLRILRRMLYDLPPRQAPMIWAAIRKLEAERDGR